MSNTIYSNYNQNFLLPPSLEDWVSADHPVRFIREFVDHLNLDELGFIERKSIAGRPNYSNEVLLKIWFYGYFDKIYSSRDLEKACNNQLPLVWLTGMIAPDHNTIWRFFKKNKEKIQSLFKETVRVAIQGGLVGFGLQAIDGTKVYADVSKNRSIHKKDLKALLSILDESLSEIISEIENVQKKESSKPEFKLPIKYQNKRNLKKLVEELNVNERISLKKSVEAGINELEKAKTNHLSLTDSDCRIIKSKNRLDFNFNAQAVVDEKEQIITAASVTNDVSDNHQMTRMIAQAERNTEQPTKESVLDGGYFSGAEIAKAEAKGYSITLPIPKDKAEYAKNKFKYDANNDCYTCPVGKVLHFQRIMRRKDKNKPDARIYHCRNYRDCPSREKCSTNKRGRTIERSPFDDAIQRQIERQDKEYRKELFKKRKHIVEPVFGWIKHNNHFKRWHYRGLENVDAQWNLICSTINLKKIFAKWKEKKLALG